MSFVLRAVSLTFVCVASATQVFAKSNVHESTNHMLAGYNAPATVTLQGGYDVGASASFTYWSPSQENMELGIVSDSADTDFTINGDVVNLPFDYAPGFQLAFWTDLYRDHWDGLVRYTWLHNTDRVSTSLDPSGTKSIYPLRQKPSVSVPQYLDGRGEWNLQMDLIDVEMGRSYYVGEELTVRPYFGLRSALIRQKADTAYLNNIITTTSRVNVYITQRAHSWGIGPMVGVDSHWLLGQGLSLYCAGFGDLLFTQYTTLNWSQKATDVSGVFVAGSRYLVGQHDLNYVRPHLSLDLGVSWGSYFFSDRVHCELMAEYGFQVFFNQNMFRGFLDDQSIASVVPNGNLYVQGFTFTTKWDF